MLTKHAAVEPERKPLVPGPPTRGVAWLPRGRRKGGGRTRFWPLTALVALTVTLGTWGFSQLELKPPLNFGQSLYHAFKLFTIDLGPAGGGSVGGRLNWQILLASVLAGLLLVRALVALLGDRLRRLIMRRSLANHVIVVGAGVHGARLVKALADKHDVVVVDVDANAAGMLSAPAPHEWRLVGNAVQRETLLAAGIERASWLVALSGDSFVNSQIVSTVRQLPTIRDRLHVLVQVEDPTLGRFLEEDGAAPVQEGVGDNAKEGVAPRPVVTPFSPQAIAAEVLLKKAKFKRKDGEEVLLLQMREGKAPHLILAGDHPFLDAVSLAALRRWRVRVLRSIEEGAKPRRPPLRLSVYGPGAVTRVERFRRRWMPEPTVLEIEAKDMDLDGAHLVEEDRWLVERRSADHLVVACLDELAGVRLTLELAGAVGGDVLMTRITTQPTSVLDEQLERRTADRRDRATTRVKSLAELGSDAEEMTVDSRERLARVLAHASDPQTARRLTDELFDRDDLKVHSDPGFRIPPGEHSLLEALVEPVPLSALVRARLAVEYTGPPSFRRAAETLSRSGAEIDAFVGWCEYARRLPRADLHARRDAGYGLADEVLRLRQNAVDAAAGARITGGGTGLGAGKWRVSIFAGGAASLSLESRTALERFLPRALDGYDGLVFSGGTAVGLPGVVGEVTRRLGVPSIGYAPAGHGDAELYRLIRETSETSDFRVLQPLAMWTGILDAGVPVEQVRLVACPGGPITIAEIVLARALGARVAWFDPAGDAPLALDEMLPSGADGVIELPADVMTLRAFIQWTQAPDELRESIAAHIHAAYRRSQRKRKPPGDPALAPWDQLLPVLKRSNLHQADDVPNKLAAVGMQLAKGGSRLVLNDDQVEQLAEMEHGRFNLERLTDGWQIGDREVVRLATPHLRPWDELDDDVKEYDREAVRNIPAALASAGWGVEPREASASTNGGAARDRVAV